MRHERRAAMSRIRPVSPRRREPITVYPDGREVCNLNTREDEREYRRRIGLMYERQQERCCIGLDGCVRNFSLFMATFDHEDGRGMGGGKRDDRIEKDGHPYNGAACIRCNSAKGSRFFDYNGNRARKEAQPVPAKEKP